MALCSFEQALLFLQKLIVRSSHWQLIQIEALLERALVIEKYEANVERIVHIVLSMMFILSMISLVQLTLPTTKIPTQFQHQAETIYNVRKKWFLQEKK
mmetsp:Transcript_12463/g.18838  ORF Transcript_12463/g.18838 Transcript_12463/m.18838 type:complete len:99 (-) Transcript_12463:197-493(-)